MDQMSKFPVSNVCVIYQILLYAYAVITSGSRSWPR